MFYATEKSNNLRFGDVVKGFVFADLTINEPLLGKRHNYKIDIEIPSYCSVLTPCCSIENSTICITPLVKVKGDFFSNPNFVKDLTLINYPLLPNQMMSEEKWSELPEDRKKEILNKNKSYVQIQYFVYDGNDLFDSYEIKKNTTSHYMIDFKNVQKIKCDKIKRVDNGKSCDLLLLESKALELSIESRNSLREKIAYFYSNPPKEDLRDGQLPINKVQSEQFSFKANKSVSTNFFHRILKWISHHEPDYQ